MVFRKTILILCFIGIYMSSGHAQTTTKSSVPIITLERTTDAFGVAPAYRLSIYADGTVIYKAIPHETSPFYRTEKRTKQRRAATGQISRSDLGQLISEFERIDYFLFKDGYPMSGGFGPKPTDDCPVMYTDHTSASTSFFMNGKTKKVFHYLGCKGNDAAEKLTQLENRIDEIVNTRKWLNEDSAKPNKRLHRTRN